jgi:large subunit ribosomal protein L23
VNPYQVLLRPITSEKTDLAREETGKYVFRITPEATKKDVANAISTLFEVKVKNVRTMTIRGKIRRRGNHYGKSSNFKKAVVTLAEGQQIKIFENR